MTARSYRSDMTGVRIIGVDFTSAPRRAKPITVAHRLLRKSILQIEEIEGIENFDSFELLLRRPGPWTGGFDFPFGLPRDASMRIAAPTCRPVPRAR